MTPVDREEESISQLRTLITEEGLYGNDIHGMVLDDAALLRHLRQKNFDVAAAKISILKTVEWRKSFGFDQMHTEWIPIVSHENSTGKIFVRGFDKDGHVIMYMIPREENSSNHDGNIKHLIFNLEKAIACSKAKYDKDQFILLIDYKGFTLSKSAPFKTSLESLNLIQDHYPGRIKRIYMINTPWFFSMFWSMISPFLDPISLNMFVFVKESQAKTLKDKLKEDFDVDSLISNVGGLDDKPFDSEVYVHGPFTQEFNAMLKEPPKLTKMQSLVISL